MTDDDLTPLGQLLEAARLARGLSQNGAAKEAASSGTAWRRIIRGKARINGVEVEFPGKPTTVARMAIAVGLPSDVVRKAGRPDVAEAMRTMGPPTVANPRLSVEEAIKRGVSRLELTQALEGMSPNDDESAALRYVLEAEDKRFEEQGESPAQQSLKERVLAAARDLLARGVTEDDVDELEEEMQQLVRDWRRQRRQERGQRDVS